MNNDIQKRLEQTVFQINNNIDSRQSIDDISKTVGISKYHFHRLFTGFTGVSIGKYMRLATLKRSAFQLAFREWQSVTNIAFDAGYENTESFSRAFKREYGQTPSGFRRNPDWQSWHNIHDSLIEKSGNKMPQSSDITIEIVDFPETKIATLEHHGSPNTLKRSIANFIKWRRANKLPPHKSKTFNILYDDPQNITDDEYRFDLCCAVNGDIPKNDAGIIMKFIPSGRCARLRHVGPDHQLETSVRYLVDNWFMTSGEKLRDFPIFLERVSFFPEVSEHEMITDIYLPID